MKQKTKTTKRRTKELDFHVQTFQSSGCDCEKARKEVADAASAWLMLHQNYLLAETHEHTHLDIKDDKPFFTVSITFKYKEN